MDAETTKRLLTEQIKRARRLAEQGWPPAVEMVKEAKATLAAMERRTA